MKKMVLSSLVLLSTAGYAEQLSSFKDIADAVSQGKKITLVMSLGECASQKMTLNAVTASVRPNAFLVIDNRITASDRHFTLEHPIARNKPIFEFVKYTINSDGSVTIKNTVMNATNYEQLTSFQVNCKLNEGVKVFS